MAKKLLKVDGKYITKDGKPVLVNLENQDDVSSYESLVDDATQKVTENSDLADEIEYLLVNGLIDGSPKGVYDNLTALQKAHPYGAIGVYLTKNDGHWYYWNSEAWTDGGVYQGSEKLVIKMLNVDVSTWVSDATYADYSYKATIEDTRITSDTVADVSFGLTQALSGNYAPICETFNGGIYIYSKVNTAITIPSIVVVI